MQANLLVLGGTADATALGRELHARGVAAVMSLAGRVERPKRQPIPYRIGGFGGAEGLAAFLRAEGITHVVDATHPFAAQMSRNAVAACAATNVPLVALNRPEWRETRGDNWDHAADIGAAVRALGGPARRVMLAVGRMHLSDFAPNPQHFYLLRLVDPPATPPPFPEAHVVVSRGPFTEAGDAALMRAHGIDLVVSKNSGGTGAHAKIAAARGLGLPVLMIDRPAMPDREEREDVAGVLDWLGHAGTDRGV